MESVLNQKLEKYNSKILGIIVIPDYKLITEYEEKKKSLEDLVELKGSKQPIWLRIWVKKKNRTQEHYEAKIFEIEQKMKDFLSEPIESSGDAFVIFDSFRSMSKWIEKFKITHTKRWAIMWNSCFYKLLYQNSSKNFLRDSMPTVDENNEQLIDNKDQVRKMTLSMSLAKNPVDIVWINMGGTKGIYFFRRYLWNILGLFLIIFISTPMVIMKTLKSISEKNINLHFMENIPFLEKVSSLLPTLTTVAINLALILLIDHSAVTEKHSTHSTLKKVSQQYSIKQ